MDKKQVRQATHASSWYQGNSQKLNQQLTQFLNKANPSNLEFIPRAIIAPQPSLISHAGYFYSGSTAAYAYKYLLNKKFNRVFLLGPSHHQYIQGCALSKLKVYDTPFGPIQLDRQGIKHQNKQGKFVFSTKSMQEDEHSLEMHLPFLKKTIDSSFKLVPIMVGQTNLQTQIYYAKLLLPYFQDPNTLFVFSTDFCHWGKRFGFVRYQKEDGEIWQSIQKMDRVGMELIEKKNAKGFNEYIKATKNTICGRHPLGILLGLILQSKKQSTTKFVYYSQSQPVSNMMQSSVSYALGVDYLK